MDERACVYIQFPVGSNYSLETRILRHPISKRKAFEGNPIVLGQNEWFSTDFRAF